ncbi:hypothetical protein [Desulfovibrio gilichinskyi]|uniref:Uncharacterized protein n=1 Tax=Desulfovibrio gilichinskyi TaxID=1519643 RepID=A0A1X7C2R6_9BACT|nr:hypothetical protein [Desulfovibrio gilichinskyi]SME88470.1 hypothetical protein SAMN06295933_0167 [Desulfovibrio gilichinskyi]
MDDPINFHDRTGLATARRSAPYVEKGLDKVSKIAKRGIATAKDAYNEADVTVRNFTSNKKYEVNLNDITDGATSFVDGLPPSNGPINGPVTAFFGTKLAVKNAKEAYKEIKNKIDESKTKKNIKGK